MGKQSLIVCVAILFVCTGAVLRADGKSPEAVLKDKGLSKAGFNYLLDGDLNLHEPLRTMRMAKRQMDDYTVKHRQLENKVENARNIQARIEAAIRQVGAEEDRTSRDSVNYNLLVRQYNELLGQREPAQRNEEQCERELSQLKNPTDSYITALLELSDGMESTAKQYEALAADSEVKEALKQINESSRVKMRLGPSAQFTSELRAVRWERQKVNAAAIKCDTSHGVPVVQVTLNDQVTENMISDSGASLVLLSWTTAERLGILPPANAQKLTLSLADGKNVEARLGTLHSVRLGQFTAENIECAILPKDAKDSDDLLGGTFWRHFIYRLDLAAGEIHVAQLGAKPSPGRQSASNSSLGHLSSPGEGATGEVARLHQMAQNAGDQAHATPFGAETVGDGTLTTPIQFAPPVRIDVIAMTAGNNIRLHYGDKGMVILNWEQNPNELRFHRPDSGQIVALAGKGHVIPHAWHHIVWVIEETRSTVTVDGQTRATVTGNFGEVYGAAGVGGADSKVSIKQFEFTRLR